MGTPQLNIKDAEITAMVRELAGLTGETQTEAVRMAVRERLDRERGERDRDSARKRREKQIDDEQIRAGIRKIQAEVQKHMKPGDFLTGDDLYGESGLPK